jgi:hypothetical protein
MWWRYFRTGRRRAEGATEAAYERLLADPWVKRVYLEQALRVPRRAGAYGWLGLILVPPPAAVVAEARALLAKPATAGGLNGPVLVDWVETCGTAAAGCHAWSNRLGQQ